MASPPLSYVPERLCCRKIHARHRLKVEKRVRYVRYSYSSPLRTLSVCVENIVRFSNNQNHLRTVGFERKTRTRIAAIVGLNRRNPSFFEKKQYARHHNDEAVVSTRLLCTGYCIRMSNRVDFNNVILSAEAVGNELLLRGPIR